MKGDLIMKFSTFMSIAAFAALVFGLAFLLVPGKTVEMYGIDLDPSGEYIARYFGSAFVGVAAITWLGRFANPKGSGASAIILGDFILCITGGVVALFDKFYGVGNDFVWSTVAIYFLLAIGFGYYYFKRPDH